MEDTSPPADVLAISHVHIDRDAELGRGADATVYQGTWHGAQVAVKVFHGGVVNTKRLEKGARELGERFASECKRLRELRHPNVVQFLGTYRAHGDLPALVTELLPCSLMVRYQDEPILTLAQVFRLLDDTVSGLAYLHALGIVHRDLTTRNVLVTGDCRAKVADVGVACSLHGRNPVDSSATGLTRAPGTLLYMSPEALGTPPVYDETIDVFSFGVLTLAVLLRREPSPDLLLSDRFEVTMVGNRTAIQEVQRRKGDLDFLGRYHPLYTLIVRCLSNEPSDRPCASQLQAELRALRQELKEGESGRPSLKESSCMRCQELEADVRALRKQLALAMKSDSNHQYHSRNTTTLPDGSEDSAGGKQSKARTLIGSEGPCSKLDTIHHSKEWSVLKNAPFAKAEAQRGAMRTTVHCGCLYVANTAQSGESALHWSADLKTWHCCPTPPVANLCTALISHNDSLYGLWTTKDAADRGHPVVHRFKSSSWERTANGLCPVKLLDPAAFQANDSLVLAGGWDGMTSTNVVLAYSLTRFNWVSGYPWPQLPRAIHGITAVETDCAVHLVGGSSRTNNQSKPNSAIFTMAMNSGRPAATEWIRSIMPVTPFDSSGACNALGKLIVAGGYQQGKGIRGAVFSLDEKSGRWRALPSLSVPRYYCSMTFFRGYLFVFGGRTATGLTGHSESLRYYIPSG